MIHQKGVKTMRKNARIVNLPDAPADYRTNTIQMFESAKGAYLYAVQKQYIDINNGKGSVILGHNDEDINKCLSDIVKCERNIHTGPTTIIGQLSDLILADYKDKIDSISYFTTGTSACRAAVNVAREYSGKKIILSAGYHGFDLMWKQSDNFLEQNEYGVIDFYFIPSLLSECIEKYRNQIALVIFSPDYIYLKPETLIKIIEISKEADILVCCDDVKQGYRYCKGTSLDSINGESVDLYTNSKGLANGYRLSCLLGNGKLMKNSSKFTFTSYYDMIPYYIALTSLLKMNQVDGYKLISSVGEELFTDFNILFRKYEIPIMAIGKGPTFQFVAANDELEELFNQACFENEIVIYEGDNQNISCAFDKNVVSELQKRMEQVCIQLQDAKGNVADQKISSERIFKSAINMMDGAADIGSVDDKIRWLKEIL